VAEGRREQNVAGQKADDGACLHMRVL
jgi:hypothetical protein